ncbi:MAG: CpsB/CapC family capsule biosynthesis tyrosine phosphatase, partial [Clostridiales bacterium]
VILKSLEKTEKLIKTNNINLSLYPGSEVLLSDEIPGLLKKGNIVTLNNSRYIMIEFRMGSIPLYAEEILFEIKLNGYIPIIAHPERNLEILKNPDIIERLIGTGCLLQINSGSLTGDFKRSNKKMALYLLKKSKVTFIGTDAHSYRMRKPTMYKAFFMIHKKFGLEMAKNLFYRNPYKILHNKEI